MKRLIGFGMIALFVTALAFDCATPVSAEQSESHHAVLTKSKKSGKLSVTGKVVHGKSSKGVAGAHVHVHHKHHHSSKKSTSTTTPSKKSAKKRHAGVTTGKDGSFTLKSVPMGSHTLVAHKHNVGSGHLKISAKAGSSNVFTIRLHKHHHSHSTTTGTVVKPKTK